jgi:GTPase SAR1 family protein
VAKYIRGLDRGSNENTEVSLVFIGDGEVGKTATLASLKALQQQGATQLVKEGDSSSYQGTVGVLKAYYKPFDDIPLVFVTWDLGGQVIYSLTQHLLMPQKSVYALVWRVYEALDVSLFPASARCDVCREHILTADVNKQGKVYRSNSQGICHAKCASYENCVKRRLEQIHHNSPDAVVVLVATHIDSSSEDDVSDQCNRVADIAKQFSARQTSLDRNASISLHSKGRSICVNNSTGEGIEYLRQQLRQIAESLSTYGDLIPPSYAKIRERLRSSISSLPISALVPVPSIVHTDSTSQQQEVTAVSISISSCDGSGSSSSGSIPKSIEWDDFVQTAADCGITDPMALNSAVRFFHDIGDIRYFGEVTKHSSNRRDHGSLGISEVSCICI